METFFQEYLDRLQSLHDNIVSAVDGLPQEAFDWIPGPEMNSLGVLIVHIVGSERYWIGDLVGRDPSERDREAEFRVQGLDAAGLKSQLAKTLDHSRSVLEKLNLNDLDTLCTSPRDGHQYTAAWSLAHALEHAAIHTGHIQITRQLWDGRGLGIG